MIIKALFSLVLGLLRALLSVFPNFPSLPDSLVSMLDEVLVYLSAGCGILANFVVWPIVVSMVGVTMAVYAGYEIYQFVMFVLRKIPMLGIE